MKCRISTELVEKFTELGGHKCDSPADVGKGRTVSVCVCYKESIANPGLLLKLLLKEMPAQSSSSIITLKQLKFGFEQRGIEMQADYCGIYACHSCYFSVEVMFCIIL
ncbi:hypothetical protein ISN44_As07g005030 [Arabidopsis suecica]|uniref:Uncharacterized protein n=1 Tax=Arabidopsis suecica TaxID=45249 RepID=A0A8T2BL40_ARASU|nr:hypothetical protein ISN44_As07g005030 [Arabidopsis suecica]